MKIRDEKEMQKQTNKDRNEQGGGSRSYSEMVRRAQWFCCALKLGFL